MTDKSQSGAAPAPQRFSKAYEIAQELREIAAYVQSKGMGNIPQKLHAIAAKLADGVPAAPVAVPAGPRQDCKFVKLHYGRRCVIHDCWDYTCVELGRTTEAPAPLPPPQEPTIQEFQDRMTVWGTRCFGQEHMEDRTIRGMRLLEEAIEFAQSVEVPTDKAHSLIEYVYGRPAGKPEQELGGVAVTMLVAASSLGKQATDIIMSEVTRVEAKSPEHFTARNQTKVDLGFTTCPASLAGETRTARVTKIEGQTATIFHGDGTQTIRAASDVEIALNAALVRAEAALTQAQAERGEMKWNYGHILVCNYQTNPIGSPGCICEVINRKDLAELRAQKSALMEAIEPFTQSENALFAASDHQCLLTHDQWENLARVYEQVKEKI